MLDFKLNLKPDSSDSLYFRCIELFESGHIPELSKAYFELSSEGKEEMIAFTIKMFEDELKNS